MKESALVDINPSETVEWLSALDSVIREEGNPRAAFLLKTLASRFQDKGFLISRGFDPNAVNTIAVEEEPQYPGDLEIEQRIRYILRWNAAAMVVKANRLDSSLGGHLATYASSNVLYEVAFNHYFRGQGFKNGGDLIFYQGHASPGMYARSFLEGRLSEAQLDHFRREIGGKGLSSYPHPYLMQDYWQFPTVSMGLGPLQGIYQARFLKYLHNRGLQDTEGRKVFVYCGDGEMDEPESTGALTIAAREKLDNLVFVVNCNLQKLDGPVVGNDNIVNLLAGTFEGAGWNVIKVLWASQWDKLFEKDTEGLLVKALNETVDGEFQNFSANDVSYLRNHLFNKFPELATWAETIPDVDLTDLRRGGHDPVKVNAAFDRAVKINNGKPTVILAMTVKGFFLEGIQHSNNAHNIKKMTDDQLKDYRDRLSIPIPDNKISEVPFYHPGKNSAEVNYMRECREKLSGFLPARRMESDTAFTIPALDSDIFGPHLLGSIDRELSTNMAYIRVLSSLLRDKTIAPRLVPIVPDECRTLGMEGLFSKLGVYSVKGQLYDPVDSGQLVYYKEEKKGQILNEGITEAGGMSSFIAAGTSYSMNNYDMVPLFLYYSMFGFQRIGDLAWAAGDAMTRGFLLGSLSGRTTLAGEGLQHMDGHSLILSSIIPNCISYDPAFYYEIAVLMREGLYRMLEKKESVFFYITMGNEKYLHPPMPEGAAEGIVKGLYRFSFDKKSQLQLIGSGAILCEVIKAAELLKTDFGVSADVWSAPSFTELRREALSVQQDNLFSPDKKAKLSYVESCLMPTTGPIVVATDYMKIYGAQIQEFLPGKRLVSLGTDGFGLSDTREALRDYFEVDANHIAYAAIKALVDEGTLPKTKAVEALKKYIPSSSQRKLGSSGPKKGEA
jgi:pyruvate dehydrogenase E1 component